MAFSTDLMCHFIPFPLLNCLGINSTLFPLKRIQLILSKFLLPHDCKSVHISLLTDVTSKIGLYFCYFVNKVYEK